MLLETNLSSTSTLEGFEGGGVEKVGHDHLSSQYRFNRIWPTAVAGKADKELTLSASACLVGGPNSVNPGQILLVYGI